MKAMYIGLLLSFAIGLVAFVAYESQDPAQDSDVQYILSK
jgi:hypothetical protein